MADAINTDSTEIWKPIPGLEGRYEASSYGRINSIARQVQYPNGSYRQVGGRILKQHVCRSTGYPSVCINAKTQNVHRLVCAAFHGTAPTAKHQVAHNDGARDNNRADNLRWADAKENAADKYKHGREQIGERAPSGKLSETQVFEIRRDYVKGYGALKRLADHYGVSSTQILHIVNRRQWTHI
jgi:NUMOD4 motif/HNH endonuclease